MILRHLVRSYPILKETTHGIYLCFICIQIFQSLSPISDFEFSFPITFQDVKYEVYVKTRPYFKEFLQQMASIYEIIIFTASKKVWKIT